MLLLDSCHCALSNHPRSCNTCQACQILLFLQIFSSQKKVPCLQITTTLSAFYVRGPKFLCTAKGVRFYHSRNVLGSCCTLWELVQDINCPWGFNLLSFHHNMDYIFNTLPHIFILHKIVSPHFIFPCHLLFFHFFKFHILPSSNFKILQWSNPEYQLWVNLE